MVWFWSILGIVLIVLELLVPGLITVFLGAGALVTAAALKLGLIEGWFQACLVWLGSSLGFVVMLRRVLMKYFGGKTEKVSTDEDLAAFGEVVEVVERISIDEEGRIKFRDTTWRAKSLGPTIEPGQEALIVYRDHLVWMVEPYEGLPSKEQG